jgi:hypothetical protein
MPIPDKGAGNTQRAATARHALLLTAAMLLSACTPVLVNGPGPPVIAPKEALTLGPAPLTGGAAKFALTTVTGMPGADQIELEQALKTYAATRKVQLVDWGDAGATYRVEGYISAIGDSNRVILVYVWDVFDAEGNRIHRFTGQEPTGGGGADPWTAITLQVVDEAARQTIDALADWSRA